MRTTREGLRLDVARRLRRDDGLARLAQLFVERGPPTFLRSDNGPAFTATAGSPDPHRGLAAGGQPDPPPPCPRLPPPRPGNAATPGTSHAARPGDRTHLTTGTTIGGRSVRRAGGAPAALGRRARPGRRLADPAPRCLAAAPHPEAAGTGRAGDREFQHPRRHGLRPFLRRGHDADRLRAHGPPRRRGRDRPAPRGGDDRALGGIHGHGRRAAGSGGGRRWLAVSPARH